MSNQETLIFLHISKTGGTTLRSIIERQFKPEEIFDLDPSYFTNNSKDYDKVFLERFQKIRDMSDAEKQEYRCVFNSRAFGLHEILPQKAFYLTMLRDPIDHYISTYYFAVNKPKHIHHEVIKSKNLSLDSFLDYFPIDNLQTRRLSACDPLDSPVDKQGVINAEAFEKAKKNLEENIAITGLLEFYDESLILMQDYMGWQDVSYIPRNVAPNREAKSALSAKTRAKLDEALSFDIQLYQIARESFEKKLAENGSNFQKRLEDLREKNHILSNRAKTNSKLKRGLRVIKGIFNQFKS